MVSKYFGYIDYSLDDSPIYMLKAFCQIIPANIHQVELRVFSCQGKVQAWQKNLETEYFNPCLSYLKQMSLVIHCYGITKILRI